MVNSAKCQLVIALDPHLADANALALLVGPGRELRLVVVGVGVTSRRHRGVERFLAIGVLGQRVVVVHPDHDAEIAGVGEVRP